MKIIKWVAISILMPVKLLGTLVGVAYHTFMVGFNASESLLSWFEKQ